MHRRRSRRAPRGALSGLRPRSEEHTSELQSRLHLVCRLLLEKKKEKRTDLSELSVCPTRATLDSSLYISHPFAHPTIPSCYSFFYPYLEHLTLLQISLHSRSM